MKFNQRIVGLMLMLTLMFGTFLPAFAVGTNGKKNIAIAAGAATVYGIVKKKPVVAVAGGLGTLYAYSKYKKSKKADERRKYWYMRRYGKNWKRYYR